MSYKDGFRRLFTTRTLVLSAEKNEVWRMPIPGGLELTLTIMGVPHAADGADMLGVLLIDQSPPWLPSQIEV